jgi:hypothetical protein
MILTKSQATAEFRECIGQSYRGDPKSRQDAWIAFLDSLLFDQLITTTQREQWLGQ